MSTRTTNAGAELPPTCPTRGSSGCKASRVDCCSDVVRARGCTSRFQYPPPHRRFPYSNLVCADRRRSPVNRNAADNEAEKYRQIQPVTPPHQKMMLLGHEHAGFVQQRARGVRLTDRKC